MDGGKIRNMAEFASVVGISRPTLSKYFNDPGTVRASTRARIEAALERHDWRPNLFAVNQNRQVTKAVGIVVPYLADPFFAEIVRTLERRCLDAGLRPALFSAHGDPALEVDILDTLRSLKPAGVLLAPLGRASDRRALERFCRDVPTVLFDSNVEGLGAAFVGSDNFQSVPMIVDYLCRTGPPPSFLEMRPVNPNANKRREAYARAMEALGHEPRILRVDGDGWDFEAIGRAGGLRALDDGTLAGGTVLCSNDRLAIGLLSAAFERGLRVGLGPGCDLRVAGHDDHPFSRFTCPSLTTVAQDYDAIAGRSMATLLALVEGGLPEARTETLFDGQLVMRASA